MQEKAAKTFFVPRSRELEVEYSGSNRYGKVRGLACLSIAHTYLGTF